MKVSIDVENCTGCGKCAKVCPEFFEMKNGKASVRKQPTTSDEEEDVIHTDTFSCPEFDAIVMENGRSR